MILIIKSNPSGEWSEEPKGEFTTEDLKWLTALATDVGCFLQGTENEWAAPIHAWHILSHFPPEEGIPPLLEVLALDWEEDMNWNDWRSEELTAMLAMFGHDAIAPLTSFLLDHSRPMWGRGAAGDVLKKIAMEHAELRDQCVARLALALQDYDENDPELNALIICFLMDVQGVEAIDVIRKAFHAERVDRKATGTLLAVEIELGLSDGKPPEPPSSLFGDDEGEEDNDDR